MYKEIEFSRTFHLDVLTFELFSNSKEIDLNHVREFLNIHREDIGNDNNYNDIINEPKETDFGIEKNKIRHENQNFDEKEIQMIISHIKSLFK